MKRSPLSGILILSGLLWVRGADAGLRILCTTFPVLEITLNVVQGREGVRVERLLPASFGCPHNYAMTPEDRRKIEAADLVVINGLGLEPFLAPLLRTGALAPKIVNASEGLQGLLPHEEGDGQETSLSHDKEAMEASPPSRDKTNPHVFVSPLMRAGMAKNIARGLARVDPSGASQYEREAAAYAERMRTLAEEMVRQVQTLKTRRVVAPQGLLDYLVRDLGLEVVGTLPSHEGEPSAAHLLDLLNKIRAKQAGAILLEPNPSSRAGQTLAREAGIPAVLFDPATAGPEDVPLDYYERVMRKNMEVLRASLGTRSGAGLSPGE